MAPPLIAGKIFPPNTLYQNDEVDGMLQGVNNEFGERVFVQRLGLVGYPLVPGGQGHTLDVLLEIFEYRAVTMRGRIKSKGPRVEKNHRPAGIADRGGAGHLLVYRAYLLPELPGLLDGLGVSLAEAIIE